MKNVQDWAKVESNLPSWMCSFLFSMMLVFTEFYRQARGFCPQHLFCEAGLQFRLCSHQLLVVSILECSLPWVEKADKRNAPEQGAEVAWPSHCSLAAERDGTEQDGGPSGGRRGWFLMLWLVTALKPVWKQLMSREEHREEPGSGGNPQQQEEYEGPAYYVLRKWK